MAKVRASPKSYRLTKRALANILMCQSSYPVLGNNDNATVNFMLELYGGEPPDLVLARIKEFSRLGDYEDE